jgi:DNA-binding transcriptional MerR regulator
MVRAAVVPLHSMAKSLSQITFDFTSVEEPVAAPQPVLVAEEKTITPEPAPAIAIKKTVLLSPEETKGKRGRKSLKDASFAAELIEIPDDEQLFKRQYYSIGEVATMFRENQSLIRYWETEFDILQPRKNRKGDRHFRPIDVKNLVMIYDLLRRRKFTIEGAKDYLKKNKRAEERFAAVQSLRKVKGFLLELKASL